MTVLVFTVSSALAERKRFDLARNAAEAKASEAQLELVRVARHLTLGEFASSIAHELDQPLASIVANSEATLPVAGA